MNEQIDKQSLAAEVQPLDSIQPGETVIESPFFSVIITTYKRADLLARAVESVMGQQFENYELLVVDDGPSDDVAEVLARFSHSATRLLRHPHNMGISAARNTGLKAARGRYVVFLDDDDAFEPAFLQEVYKVIGGAPPSVGFILVGRRRVQTGKSEIKLLRHVRYGVKKTTFMPGEKFASQVRGGASGLVLSAACIQRTGEFDTALATGEDIDFLIRASMNFDCMIIPQPLLIVHVHSGHQATQDRLAVISNSESITDRYAKILGRRTRARRHRGNARGYAALGKRRESRRAMRKAIWAAPLLPTTWAVFFLLEIERFLPAGIRRKLLANRMHGHQMTADDN